MNTVQKAYCPLIVSKLVFIVFATLCAIFIASLWLMPINKVIYFFSDDAYYYFKVAQNIILGLGSTFDGTNLSNGYHPLWMVVLLPIYALSIDTPEVSLRIILTVQALLAAGTLLLLWRYVSNILSWRYALLSLIIFFFFASPVLLLFNGLESALLIFWVMLLLYLDQKYDFLDESSSLKIRLFLGFLLAVLMLIRLDGAFFIIALAIVKIVFGRGIGVGLLTRLLCLIKLYWSTMAIFFVLISPYFVWNYLTFGHLSPISGTLKSTFPYPILDMTNFGVHTIPYMFPFILICGWVFVSMFNSSSFLRKEIIAAWKFNTKFKLLFVLWLGCLIHVLWSKLFMGWGIYQWHFVSYIPVLVLGMVFFLKLLLTKLAPPQRQYEYLLLSLSFVFIIVYNGFLSIEKGSHHSIRLDAAEWARGVDSGSAFALSDAGVFAYFNKHSTVNLDGLINGYSYQDDVLYGRLESYLQDMNVKFVADAYTPCNYEEQHTIIVRAYRGKYRYDPAGYAIRVTKAAEVFRSNEGVYRVVTSPQKKCFIVWDINKVRFQRL